MEEQQKLKVRTEQPKVNSQNKRKFLNRYLCMHRPKGQQQQQQQRQHQQKQQQKQQQLRKREKKRDKKLNKTKSQPKATK